MGAAAMPLAIGIGSSLLGSAMGGGQTPTQETTATPMNISGGGLFNTSSGGQIQLTPQMRAIQQGLFGQALGQGTFQNLAGGLGNRFLQQAGAFDPFKAAETQFNRMEAILAPQREQARQAQEARLFSQGRLGSTGGGIEQQAFQNAVEQQQAQNLVNALGQAQDIQGNMLQRGAMMGQLPLSMQTQALQNLLGIQRGAVGQLGTGMGTTQSTEQPGIGAQIGTGLMMGGMGMLGQGMGGLFGGGG